MFRFIPNDGQGMPQRRAGQARACELCRRRKKRCPHADDSRAAPSSSEMQQGPHSSKRTRTSGAHDLSAGSENSPVQTIGISSGRDQDQYMNLRKDNDPSAMTEGALDGGEERSSTTAAPSSSIYDSNNARNESRFIGHLNPEGAFLIAASPADNTVSGQPEEIGIWLSTKNQSEKPKRYLTIPKRTDQSNALYCPNPVVTGLLLPYLEGSYLLLLPYPADFAALCNIYFDEFHPTFPILDRESLEASSANIFSQHAIRQIICLFASSSSSAEPYLSLQSSEQRSILSRGEFSLQLSTAVRTALNLELIKDKLTLCQICALYSMYTQLADDRFLSIELCARAVAHSLTLGLHLPKSADQQDPDSDKRVFCCIWTLDRLNAAFQGRPVTMHERDIGIDLRTTFALQENCFRLFLHTSLLLDSIIDLYRPKADGSEADWGPDFPDFESVVHDAGALGGKPNLLATVEIFYHAVAMLSCRSQSLHLPLRRSPSYLRQSLSAHRVLSIVSEELKPKLSPTPIVPYAVSLALRFFYREFRYTKVPLFRTRAQKQLTLGCDILETLGEAFPAAACIADMVKQTLKETEKAYSSMVQPEESDGAGVNREVDSNVIRGPPNYEVQGRQPPESGSTRDDMTWSNLTWDGMSDIDVFQHFDPNFNLDAIDAALADDMQPVFPITFDSLWS